MKKIILLFLPFLLFLTGIFVSCEEVQEVSKYDNWKERNEAYLDSIKSETGESYVADVINANAMTVGKLYAIETMAGTSLGAQYVYCKKIKENTGGVRPLFTGFTNVYFYGTLVTGDRFQGNFIGYSALDQKLTEEKDPTEFDSPSILRVNGNNNPRLPVGWTAAIQYMKTGERWIIYIPYSSGFGDSDISTTYGTVPAYSILTYDVRLDSVE